MTGNLYLDLLISLGGILFIVAVSWALGAMRNVEVTEAAAAERLRFDEPDFEVRRWLIGEDRAAAAALGDREIAFVLRLGDGLVTRRAPRTSLAVKGEGDAAVVSFAEPSLHDVRLMACDAASAARWAEMLNAPAYNQGHDLS